MQPGPAVAQQLGPMGINMGKVISDVNQATQDFKGITVPVHLDVNPKDKSFTIKVLSPPTSELIKKELGIEKASGERMKTTAGNIAIEQVISVAKTKNENMLAKDMLAAVNSVIGTCMALGVLVENKSGKEAQMNIKQGKWKEEIEQQKTELSPEKKKELDDYLASVQTEQQKLIAAEEAEKQAEEEKATAEATTKTEETDKKTAAPARTEEKK